MLCIRPAGINNRAYAFSSHILFRGDSQFLSSQIIMFSWTLSIFTQSQCFTFHLTLSAPCNYLEYRYSSWNIKRRIYRSPSHYLLDSHLCLNSSVLLSPSYSHHFSRSSLVISENFLSPVCECVCVWGLVAGTQRILNDLVSSLFFAARHFKGSCGTAVQKWRSGVWSHTDSCSHWTVHIRAACSRRYSEHYYLGTTRKP